MLDEVIRFMAPRPRGIYVDATIGDGGHAQTLLSHGGWLVGIDRDEESLHRAADRLKDYKDRLILKKGNFGQVATLVGEAGYRHVDGIILDLGISSHQVDKPSRGFSFRKSGPLDMRMDRSLGITAADLLNNCSAEELTGIFKEYGEERWASRIASFVVENRRKQRLESTLELVRIIKAAIPLGARKGRMHPARRCFQALRIAVNEELKELREALPQCIDLLEKGGTLCVISYHSLEDRIVKNYFKSQAEICNCPAGLPQCVCNATARIKIVTRHPLKPTREEIAGNPRSRSALLRVAQRIQF